MCFAVEREKEAGKRKLSENYYSRQTLDKKAKSCLILFVGESTTKLCHGRQRLSLPNITDKRKNVRES